VICFECERDGWLQLLRASSRIAAAFRAWRIVDRITQVKIRAIEARHPHLKNKPQEW